MAEGKDNDENSWDNKAEFHMVDVCPLFTTPNSWYRDLVITFKKDIFLNIGNPNNEEHYILNQPHIR